MEQKTDVALASIESRIYEIRGQKVMLDFELAELYGVETKSLNLSVKRNISRFPTDFMFQLNVGEWESLRFQIETSKSKGGRRYLPYAFTEQGVAIRGYQSPVGTHKPVLSKTTERGSTIQPQT